MNISTMLITFAIVGLSLLIGGYAGYRIGWTEGYIDCGLQTQEMIGGYRSEDDDEDDDEGETHDGAEDKR